jgi:DNA-binding CsgD family transcriptional regulator/tetratricopeptide (TPR) repeat protein
VGEGTGSPFVGRRDELAALNAVLAGASAEARGGTVILGGEAGIGKTTLIDEFTRGARAMGARILAGACMDFGGGGLPFAPFVEVLRTLVRSVEPARLPAMLGPNRRGLGRLLPELDPAPPAADSPAAERGHRARLFEVVLELLERMCQVTPVVLVIEDIQWADEDSRDLLAFLVRHLRMARVVTVLSVRTGDGEPHEHWLPFLAELERDDWVHRFELEPFGREEVSALLRAKREPGDRGGPSVEVLLERSGGNPFFIEELLARVGANGSMSDDLPPRLRDVLEARLAELPGLSIEVVRAVAAATQHVDEATVRVAVGATERSFERALRAAVDAGVLVATEPLGSNRTGYVVRHPLLRDVAYRQLLSGQRLRIHAAYAASLMEQRTSDKSISPDELAFHFSGAEAYGHALPTLVEAGTDAERAYAFAQARDAYERALSIWDRAKAEEATSPDRAIVLQRAAECALLSGDHARAIELGRAVVSELGSRPEPDALRMAGAQERLRWYLWQAGDRDAAQTAVMEALAAIPADPPSAARARALAQAAGLAMEARDFKRAAALAGDALAMARTLRAPGEQALAGGILGWCQAVLGDVGTGTAAYRAALAIAERLGGPEGIALGHARLAALLDRVGHAQPSLTAALDGYAIVRKLGVSRTYGGTLLAQAAKAAYDLGRWEYAKTVAEEGLELDPVGRAATELHLVSARIDSQQGRTDDAVRHLEAARTLCQSPGLAEVYGAALLAETADMARRRGDLHAVREAVDTGTESISDDRLLDPALGWLAETALGAEADAIALDRARSGDAWEGLARVARVWDLVRQASESPPIVIDVRRGAFLAMCAAEVSRAHREHDPALWETAAVAWLALARPYPAAYARYRRAEAILASRGPRSEAASDLRAAHGMATVLGAVPLRGDIEALARQARIELVEGRDRPDRAADEESPSAALGLTEREEEVIRLVAAGWSNQQIADALFITRKTASVHVSNILGKLGVQNRVEAASIAHRLGLAASEDASVR